MIAAQRESARPRLGKRRILSQDERFGDALLPSKCIEGYPRFSTASFCLVQGESGASLGCTILFAMHFYGPCSFLLRITLWHTWQVLPQRRVTSPLDGDVYPCPLNSWFRFCWISSARLAGLVFLALLDSCFSKAALSRVDFVGLMFRVLLDWWFSKVVF
jgi:hypothetical protein